MAAVKDPLNKSEAFGPSPSTSLRTNGVSQNFLDILRLKQPLSASVWTLALMLLALVAHAPALPPVLWPLPLLALSSRRLPARRWTPALRLGGLAICYIVCALAFGWLDSTTLRLNLLLVLTLKWAESRSPREFALVAAAALVAVAIGLLHWSESAGLAIVLAALPLLLAGAGGRPAVAPGAALRAAGRQLLGALPLAAVLFLFFPRIPGPLWDIGLSFGLPLPTGIEQSNQGLGVSARLKPGQTQTGASDGQPVLVAEFANWVPPTSLLYWRGPVFYDFDGKEWRLDADYAEGNGRRIMQQGWRRAADFGRNLRSTAQEVRYKIRLTPHGGLWLYALDLPARLTAESFVGPDWQVLAHMPVHEEISYELASWLEWTAGGEMAPAPALRERALALPAGSNPRLRALGEDLRRQAPTDVPRQALVGLARGGYQVRDRFAAPSGEHVLDAVWFDTKEGNSELYAAAFVVLMRSAGVPARLVTGYRGGKLMALTDYIVVKRSHAHAWVEIWDEAQGWRRIDPTDMIAPEKFAGTQAKPKAAPQPAPSAAPKPAKAPESGSAPPTPASAFPTRAGASTGGNEDWKLPDLADWMGRWVFRLDAERQKDLLGGKGDGFAWLWLLALAALGSAAYLGVAALLGRWRENRRLPPAQRAWQNACRLLAGRGLPPRAGECPSRFAERVAASRPELAAAVRALGRAYADWRYGRAPEAAAAQVGPAARFLVNRIHSTSAKGDRP